MKRPSLLIGLSVLLFVGCSSTVNRNSNVTTNNSPITATRNSGAQVNSSSGATVVIEKFVAAAEKGDVDAMNKAFSKEATQQHSDKIRSNNKSYSDMIREIGSKEKATMFGTREKTEGDKALVTFNYGVTKNGVPANPF